MSFVPSAQQTSVSYIIVDCRISRDNYLLSQSTGTFLLGKAEKLPNYVRNVNLKTLNYRFIMDALALVESTLSVAFADRSRKLHLYWLLQVDFFFSFVLFRLPSKLLVHSGVNFEIGGYQ